jgi:hypothetical protein
MVSTSDTAPRGDKLVGADIEEARKHVTWKSLYRILFISHVVEPTRLDTGREG